MGKNKKKSNKFEVFSWVFLTVSSIVFIYPMFITLMVSLSSEESIMKNGYQMFPDQFSLEAYRLLIVYSGKEVVRTIILTVGTGLLQPFLTVVLTMCMAYPLSQPDFKGRNFWRIYLVITMLFSGGLIPDYILRTTYLGLKDNILIYLIPSIGAWNVFLFRTFFVNIDKSMIESAKIDGASKFQILWKIMLPLTKALVAMQFFSGFIGRWNDIQTPLYYINDRKLYTVQYLLQEMLKNNEDAKLLIEAGLTVSNDFIDIPIESTRFALAVIAALPIFIIFPYIQKYYAKGIMLGSTKG